MNASNDYCVIMAGGIGSRFWPLSTTEKPKQFLDILGTGRSLLQMTYDRFVKILPSENFLIVTSDQYREHVLTQLPELDESQVLSEPLRRNTAPCIAYATYKILSKNQDANMIVAPSDHLILKEDYFLDEVQRGLRYVTNRDILLTLGLQPSRPETGYGYIQVAEQIDFEGISNLNRVKTFTEKPDRKMAELFLETGEFYWNSGIFLWSAKSILKAFEKHLPDVNALFDYGKKNINTSDELAYIKKVYSECPNISIDYGVMEKATNVHVLSADFGWSDLGTWGSLYENHKKDHHSNAISGDHIFLYDSKECIVNLPSGKVAVIQGLDGYIVVESDNALLVCRKDDEQQIRQFVADISLADAKK